jgi:hypothetical protein
VRSEWFAGTRASTACTVEVVVCTNSSVCKFRPANRHLPKPRQDVGRSDAQFGPCPLRVLPGRVVYDWWPSRHRTHVIHTARTPVVLQVGVFERSIVGSPRNVPYTVSGLSGETCCWNSLLRNRESIAMSGDAILAHRNNSDHTDRRNGSVNEVTGCMHTLLRPAEPPTPDRCHGGRGAQSELSCR